MSAAARARLHRAYTTASGRAFRAYVADDGRRVDVCVRDGRGELVKYSGAESRAIAEDRLAGSPAAWVVSCSDWTTRPMTHAAAERWIANVEQLGQCSSPHVIARAADPDA